MERGKRIKAINEEILLPEAIIQHIQSFLSEKEAAQTTVLSKSWSSAWSTRPNINFDQLQSRKNGGDANLDDKFSEFARKTMRRYEELNLKIESFRLCMVGAENDNSCLLADELIMKAMKMGATESNIEFMSSTVKFVLPHEVLGSENLVRLSVNCCKMTSCPGKVSCWGLKSLSLCKVYVEGDIIWDIISSCPLIEKLLLNDCKCLYEEQRFGFTTTKVKSLELGPFTELGKQNAGSFVNDPVNLFVFHRLTYLMLKYVKIDPLFFRDFSSKFPCLKDLYLDQCLSAKKIEIYSPTLEGIRIAQIVMLRAKIDVPSLCTFNLSSGHVPSLTIGTTSKEWECDIHVGCSNHLSYGWFRQFKRFLTKLNSSKVSLSIFYMPNWRDSFDYAGGIPSRPVVENLTVNMSVLDCSVFWDGLFWSCRPKFITISSWHSKYDMRYLEAACSRLTKLSENGCIPNQSMFGQSDLKEVNVGIFNTTVAEWQPVPWKTLLDVLTHTLTEQKIRFHLRWG
ncbi:hypothetical protein OROHE_009910 [Orobanche hederae]